MAISPTTIDNWLSTTTEHQRLEFKRAETQINQDDVFEYCVALANEGGGHIVLGISNDKPRKVVGTAAIGNVVKMAEKIFNTLRFRVEVEEVHHPDGRLVVLTIPSRPRGDARAYNGKFLMRSGSSLVAMSTDRLRQIFDEGKPDWLEEPAVTGIDAARIVDLLATQTFFELLGLEYPSTRDQVVKRLLDERLIHEDNGLFQIPKLAALLVAKDLNSFPDVSRKAPRVVVYNGNSKTETKLDRVGSLGYAAGFQNLISFTMSHLPQNEVVQNALRREVKLLPAIIIRELVANALIHQDFTQTGTSVMIEIYGNRVEISNPGEPVVEVDRFIDGYRSRNERLAALMRRLGICEEIGSGIDKVVQAAETYQLPAPHFRAAQERTEMIIYGEKGFEKMDREDRIRACYQHCALRFVMHERMTNQTLRERFHISPTESNVVSMVITGTAEAGLIRADTTSASRKFAKYVPYWA
jgi:ATP-dependent DNA helicase RecG